MFPYKRILVAMSLSQEDTSTLSFAARISKLAKAKTVYFAHITDTTHYPRLLAEEFLEAIRPSDKQLQKQMQALVTHYFDGSGDEERVYELHEGSPVSELLKLCTNKNIDLVVLGQSRNAAERGRVPEKVARKAPCSVVIAPEGAKTNIERILVPVDFSESSGDALDVATTLAGALDISHVYCLHAYRIPAFYRGTGRSYEEFLELTLEHAKKEYESFIGGVDLKGITVIPIYELTRRPSSAIRTIAEDRDIDLVVMGTRGRRLGAGILLGSVTERAIQSCSKPLMAVKRKGAGMNVLEAIRKL